MGLESILPFFQLFRRSGDYYRYVAVLLPDKFYWSMKKEEESLPSEGIYAASQHCQAAYPDCISGTLKRVGDCGLAQFLQSFFQKG